MPPRMIPFPLVLLAIVGSFVLVALYADVRGREKRAMREQEPVVEMVNEPAAVAPLPDTGTTSTPEEPAEPQILRLPPEVPSSDVPAVAVYDCLRFEYFDARIIVDTDYRHLGGAKNEPLVGDTTIHLRCKFSQPVVHAKNGRTFFVSRSRTWPRDSKEEMRPDTIPDWTVFEIDIGSGELRTIAHLPEVQSESDMLMMLASNEDGSVLVGELNIRGLPASLLRIDTATGEMRRTERTPHFVPQLVFTPDRVRALGVEWRCDEGGDCFESLFLHRYNLETQQHVRVTELRNAALTAPIMLDDDRVIFTGTEQPLFVVNTSGKSAPVRTISNKVDLFALSVDGQTLLLSGPDLPLTAIPVSELPKP